MCSQCTVQRRPASSPALARMNGPAETPPMATPLPRQLAQPREGVPIVELRRIAAGTYQEKIEFADVGAESEIRQHGSTAGSDGGLIARRRMPPAIQVAPGEQIGGAQRLDRGGIGHERKARHEKEPDRPDGDAAGAAALLGFEIRAPGMHDCRKMYDFCRIMSMAAMQLI